MSASSGAGSRRLRLPDLEAVVGREAELLREFMGLTLNPASLAVIVRLVELGLVDTLGDGVWPLEALMPEATGKRRGVGVEATGEQRGVGVEAAVELGCGLGLLRRTGAGLKASPLARRFLARSSPLRLLGHVEHYASYLKAASAIAPALASPRRSRRSMWAAGQDREAHDRYFAARQAYNESRRAYFWESSYLLLRAHLQRDLTGHRRACDVGAGPAGFAALLARGFSGLEVHAVDASFAHESYRRRTAEALAAEGAEVTLWGSNALHDPLPVGLDLVTFNRLVSGVPRDGVDAWLGRAHAALEPGGVLAAVDYIMTGDPHHDRYTAMVVAQWMGKDRHLLSTEPPAGPDDDKHQWGWTRPWRVDELREALRRAGFVEVGFAAADPPFTLVWGRRG